MNKPTKKELRRDHLWIHKHFYKNGLLNKYCLIEKTLVKRSIDIAIKEFKKIYGNKKIIRSKLFKDHHWIYYYFRKNNLLDKYCQETGGYRSIEDAKREFKKTYGSRKVAQNILRKDHSWIFQHFNRNGLLDKYCQPSQTQSKADTNKA